MKTIKRNKHLLKLLRSLHEEDSYNLVTCFFNDSAIFFEDIEKDVDYFVDCIEDLSDKHIISILRDNIFNN